VDAETLTYCARAGLTTLVDVPAVAVEALAALVYVFEELKLDLTDASNEALLRGPKLERTLFACLVVQ
jgi:hypothetical protein